MSKGEPTMDEFRNDLTALVLNADLVKSARCEDTDFVAKVAVWS